MYLLYKSCRGCAATKPDKNMNYVMVSGEECFKMIQDGYRLPWVALCSPITLKVLLAIFS